MNSIPDFVQPFLWSYDIEAMNIKRDKRRIITNVLNLGTIQATNWIFSVYKKEDIAECIEHPLPGEWSKKSLALWSLLLNVKPQVVGRKV